MSTKTAFVTTSPAQRWAGGTRSRQAFVAEMFDRAAQTNDESLESARIMSQNRRSGKPLQRAPAR